MVSIMFYNVTRNHMDIYLNLQNMATLVARRSSEPWPFYDWVVERPLLIGCLKSHAQDPCIKIKRENATVKKTFVTVKKRSVTVNWICTCTYECTKSFQKERVHFPNLYRRSESIFRHRLRFFFTVTITFETDLIGASAFSKSLQKERVHFPAPVTVTIFFLRLRILLRLI